MEVIKIITNVVTLVTNYVQGIENVKCHSNVSVHQQCDQHTLSAMLPLVMINTTC